MFNSFPQEFLLPSGIVLIVSVALVIYLEGIIGAMEIPSVAGNVLSFARILAVGLVGTVIAFILNDLAFPSPGQGFIDNPFPATLHWRPCVQCVPGNV